MRTNLLVTLFLPFRDQHGICVVILQEPVVEAFTDSLLLVVKLVYVPTALVRDLEDGPLRLVFGDVVCRGIEGVLHLVAEYEEIFFNIAKAIRWRLPLGRRQDRRHFRM